VRLRTSAIWRRIVYEQAHAENPGARLDMLFERDKHRNGVAGARDHDALTGVHPLEQL
jgi:hypothetical protein